uniref:Secreted protein n=1 Tax=Bursaphelenchus xylophilus TaxID=6326 RepID=A0A1I7S8N5_BURXY
MIALQILGVITFLSLQAFPAKVPHWSLASKRSSPSRPSLLNKADFAAPKPAPTITRRRSRKGETSTTHFPKAPSTISTVPSRSTTAADSTTGSPTTSSPSPTTTTAPETTTTTSATTTTAATTSTTTTPPQTTTTSVTSTTPLPTTTTSTTPSTTPIITTSTSTTPATTSPPTSGIGQAVSNSIAIWIAAAFILV